VIGEEEFDIASGIMAFGGMTICTACIFRWMYPDGNVGSGIIAASDRMLSDGGLGIEYEASRWKTLMIGKTHMVFVAGELTFNSLALGRLVEQMQVREALTTRAIAEAYGSIVSQLAFERAAKRIVEPLGISAKRWQSDDLKWQDIGLPEGVLSQVLDQLQSETVDCEAIVLGCDGREAHLVRVDNRGVLTLHDDIGFVSIGSGGIHASGYYMQAPYTHVLGYHRALLLTYFGKKRAEVAPGVGRSTNMFLITEDGANEISDFELTALEKSFARAERSAERLLPALEKTIFSASQKELVRQQELAAKRGGADDASADDDQPDEQ
jgi:hypothetical protein